MWQVSRDCASQEDVPRDPGFRASLGVSLPSLASSSDKALMSFSREARDSRMCRSTVLSRAPTFGEGDSCSRSLLAARVGALGQGPGTPTCSASLSSRLRASEASASWEAWCRVACVWLASRLARRWPCFPSLSKVRASCRWASGAGRRGDWSEAFWTKSSYGQMRRRGQLPAPGHAHIDPATFFPWY